MSTDTTLAFHLPEGWTLRKVVTAMVQEWLPPFRAEPAMKAARWVVQSVMESADQGGAPLWEPGISTSEYETRLDQVVRSWVSRATAGRGKGTILARVALDEERPGLLQLSPGTAFPETLFDADKVDEVTGGAGPDGLFAALLTQHGFKPAN
ncbi:MAG: hypothetical protein K0R39_3977 [Symbiobacteriaceae bacterium]|nr:hypothetical protein [Symbiobacteriaceae bacterium]